MPSDLSEFVKSVMAVLGLAANIFFWQHSDYFDAASELKPLLHIWSLRVEEQFYLFFPIFLILAWQAGRRLIVGLLVIGSLLSLALSQYGTSVRPVATFFLLPTRAWEPAMGSLIAFYRHDTVRDTARDLFPPALFSTVESRRIGIDLL